MKHLLRSVLALALCLAVFLPTVTPAGAAEAPVIYAEAAILIDAVTGQVLYEKNARTPMQPASLTKILTCLLAMEESTPDALVTVTPEATRLMPSAAAIGLSEGEVLTMAQLLHATMLPSANDAANAVAIHLGGSISGFARRMNARAHELGLTGSSFTNPNGLPARGHLATAYDLAQITREALTHPEFLDYAGSVSYAIPASPQHRGYSFLHLNRTLRRASEFYDARAIAGKTGWTDLAGNCLMTVGEQDGRRLIAVVLHADSEEVGGAAYRDTRALFDYGFSAFRPLTASLPARSFLFAGGETEYQLSASPREVTFLFPEEQPEPGTLTLEIARQPERVAAAGGVFWGEVVLVDESGKELLTAARIPLTAHPLAAEALGPSREVYLLETERKKARGDIPLALGASLLAVALLALTHRGSRREAEKKELFWAELDRREGDIFAKVKEEEGLL